MKDYKYLSSIFQKISNGEGNAVERDESKNVNKETRSPRLFTFACRGGLACHLLRGGGDLLVLGLSLRSPHPRTDLISEPWKHFHKHSIRNYTTQSHSDFHYAATESHMTRDTEGLVCACETRDQLKTNGKPRSTGKIQEYSTAHENLRCAIYYVQYVQRSAKHQPAITNIGTSTLDSQYRVQIQQLMINFF